MTEVGQNIIQLISIAAPPGGMILQTKIFSKQFPAECGQKQWKCWGINESAANGVN